MKEEEDRNFWGINLFFFFFFLRGEESAFFDDVVKKMRSDFSVGGGGGGGSQIYLSKNTFPVGVSHKVEEFQSCQKAKFFPRQHHRCVQKIFK